MWMERTFLPRCIRIISKMAVKSDKSCLWKEWWRQLLSFSFKSPFNLKKRFSAFLRLIRVAAERRPARTWEICQKMPERDQKKRNVGWEFGRRKERRSQTKSRKGNKQNEWSTAWSKKIIEKPSSRLWKKTPLQNSVPKNDLLSSSFYWVLNSSILASQTSSAIPCCELFSVHLIISFLKSAEKVKSFWSLLEVWLLVSFWLAFDLCHNQRRKNWSWRETALGRD